MTSERESTSTAVGSVFHTVSYYSTPSLKLNDYRDALRARPSGWRNYLSPYAESLYRLIFDATAQQEALGMFLDIHVCALVLLRDPEWREPWLELEQRGLLQAHQDANGVGVTIYHPAHLRLGVC